MCISAISLHNYIYKYVKKLRGGERAPRVYFDGKHIHNGGGSSRRPLSTTSWRRDAFVNSCTRTCIWGGNFSHVINILKRVSFVCFFSGDNQTQKNKLNFIIYLVSEWNFNFLSDRTVKNVIKGCNDLKMCFFQIQNYGFEVNYEYCYFV